MGGGWRNGGESDSYSRDQDRRGLGWPGWSLLSPSSLLPAWFYAARDLTINPPSALGHGVSGGVRLSWAQGLGDRDLGRWVGGAPVGRWPHLLQDDWQGFGWMVNREEGRHTFTLVVVILTRRVLPWLFLTGFPLTGDHTVHRRTLLNIDLNYPNIAKALQYMSCAMRFMLHSKPLLLEQTVL